MKRLLPHFILLLHLKCIKSSCFFKSNRFLIMNTSKFIVSWALYSCMLDKIHANINYILFNCSIVFLCFSFKSFIKLISSTHVMYSYSSLLCQNWFHVLFIDMIFNIRMCVDVIYNHHFTVFVSMLLIVYLVRLFTFVLENTTYITESYLLWMHVSITSSMFQRIFLCFGGFKLFYTVAKSKYFYAKFNREIISSYWIFNGNKCSKRNPLDSVKHINLECCWIL